MMAAMTNNKGCPPTTSKPSANHDDDSITVWEGMPQGTGTSRSPSTVTSGSSRTLLSPPTDLLSPATQTLNVLSQNMDDLRYNMATETRDIYHESHHLSASPTEASPTKPFVLPPPDPKNCIPLETWKNDYQHQYDWIPITVHKPGASLGMVIQRDQFYATEHLGQIGLTHCKILRVFPGGSADTSGIRVDDWMCRSISNAPILAQFEEVQEWAKSCSFEASVLRLKKGAVVDAIETTTVRDPPGLKEPPETNVGASLKMKPRSSGNQANVRSSNKAVTHLQRQRQHHNNQNNDSLPIKKRKNREKTSEATSQPAAESPIGTNTRLQGYTSCKDWDDVLPFCRLCNHFKKYGERDQCHKRPRIHHAWCPQSAFFENNGAEDLLSRIQFGRQELKCVACDKEYQAGKLEPLKSHSQSCRQNQKRLDQAALPSQPTQVEQPRQEMAKPNIGKKQERKQDKKLRNDQDVASKTKPERTEVANSMTFKRTSKIANPKITTPNASGNATRNVADVRQVTPPPPTEALTRPSVHARVQSNCAPVTIDNHQENAPPKLRWESTVENPWGVQGFQDGDIMLYGPQHGIGHHEILLPSPRYCLQPFAPSSIYCSTHCTPDEGYVVLRMSRDPAGKAPWGFGVTRDEFGNACLVDHVQPMTPACGARALGSENIVALYVHDMVVMVNGRMVGGMTQFGLELEIESSGPCLTLVISRYKHAAAAAQQFAAIEQNVLKGMDAACCDQRLLGWHEIGNSAMGVSTNTYRIPDLGLGGNSLGGGIRSADPAIERTASQEIVDYNHEEPNSQANYSPVDGDTNTNATNELNNTRLPTTGDVDLEYVTNEDEITEIDDNELKEDWDDDQNAWNGCVCGRIHKDNDHMFWIQCEGCDSWYDVSEKCVGFDENQAKSVSYWYCSACKDSQSSRSVPSHADKPSSMTDAFHGTRRTEERQVNKFAAGNKPPMKAEIRHDPSPNVLSVGQIDGETGREYGIASDSEKLVDNYGDIQNDGSTNDKKMHERKETTRKRKYRRRPFHRRKFVEANSKLRKLRDGESRQPSSEGRSRQVTSEFNPDSRKSRKPVMFTEKVTGNGDVDVVFEKGDLVYVEGHAWPGWNCEGGIGHVINSHLGKETGIRGYDIKYVIGGTVKGVDADFVQAYSFS